MLCLNVKQAVFFEEYCLFHGGAHTSDLIFSVYFFFSLLTPEFWEEIR